MKIRMAYGVWSILLILGGWAHAQEPPGDVHLAISEGARFVRVAVPPPLVAHDAPVSVEWARELRDTMINDLSFAWSVELLNPALYKHVPAWSLHDLKLDTWRSLGADSVLVVTVESRAGTVTAEGRLYDARTGQMIFGKRFRGEPTLCRTMAHAFADEAVYYYTGAHGPFRAQLAFARRDGAKNRIICTSDYDGANVRRVVENGFLNMLPAWSPDVKHILYTSFAEGSPNLFLVDRFGLAKPRRLTKLHMATSGSFSPDGSKIAFGASDGDGNIDVYLTNRDGSGLRRLTHHSGIDTSPSWSPTGREIAFTSDRGGSPQIYLMDAEGANVRRASWQSSYCDAPRWSPDGSRLLYVTRAEGNFHLTALDMPTAREIRLTPSGADHESPSWSPDGSLIAYASNKTRVFQIYVMRSDGTRARQITFDSEHTAPAWSGFVEP